MITKNMELQKQKERERRVFFEKEKFIANLERSTGLEIYLRCVEDATEYDENYGAYINKERWLGEILGKKISLEEIEYVAEEISNFLDAELTNIYKKVYDTHDYMNKMMCDTHNYVELRFHYENVVR